MGETLRYPYRLVLVLFLLANTLYSKGQTKYVYTTQQNSENLLQWESILSKRLDTLIYDLCPTKSETLLFNTKKHLSCDVKTLMETSQLGLLIYDLTMDSVLYSYGSKQRLRPASTMKLLTAIATLDKLGGNYMFSTSLCYSGEIKERVLFGDLFCVAGFDPMFDRTDMNAFVEGVKRLNVDTIRGYIAADMCIKDDKKLGKGWCWDDDNPILSPLLLEREDSFTLRFKEYLQEQGIVLDSGLTQKPLPNVYTRLCTRYHSIDQILLPMMRESNNLFAEAMFFQLAATKSKKSTWANGEAVIGEFLNKIGANKEQYCVVDGSGLSLYNYLTCELLVKTLRYAWKNKDIYAHLLPSLPIAGYKGTLKNRLKGTLAAGNVRAKTGTLAGISTLAGYCTAPNGHLLAFAIMNQGLAFEQKGRSFQDRVCVIMCTP